MNKNSKVIGSFLLVFGLLASTVSNAWHGAHERYRHHPGYNYHRPTMPYDNGFFGGGWGPGPEVIINVPAPNYFVPMPECYNIEVCNPFGACWIESRCN
ncbi:MAG: hypothetical protein H0U73_03170 [Tatlockia sp.]|nr:hypothetical protein [Tatlockia sp.]